MYGTEVACPACHVVLTNGPEPSEFAGHYENSHCEWEFLQSANDHIGSGIRLRAAVIAYVISNTMTSSMLNSGQGYYCERPDKYRHFVENGRFRPHPDAEEIRCDYYLKRRVICVKPGDIPDLRQRYTCMVRPTIFLVLFI